MHFYWLVQYENVMFPVANNEFVLYIHEEGTCINVVRFRLPIDGCSAYGTGRRGGLHSTVGE